MNQIFKPPSFDSDKLNVAARANYYLAFGFILFSLIFVTVAFLFVPELFKRSFVLTSIVVPVCIGIMALARRGRVNIASGILITMLWVSITIGAVTAGGVSAPIITGLFIIVIFSGIVPDRRTNILAGAICIATVLLIASLQTNGLLPKPIEYSPLGRASILTFFLLLATLLQNISSTNTRILLKQSQASDDRYRSLLENIPVTTYINNLEPESPTDYVSPQVEKLLGYPRNIFTDDPLFWTKILHPDDREWVIEQSRKTSISQELFDIEYRVMAKNKRVVWLRDEARLVFDENHKPLYWLGVWTDITKIKNVEEAQADLVSSMTKRTVQLQTAAEVSRAATSILDINELLPNVVELIRSHFEYYYVGIFLVDNEKGWAILRAATGDMGEQMIESGHRLKIEDSSMIGWCIRHSKARIALDVGEDAVRFANPHLPLTRSEIALPLIALGEVIGAMTIQSEQPAAFSKVDITALQAMADQVANAIENARLFTERVNLNEELEAQNEELERFTYTVSHDLRSPLVTIRGFLGYLKQDAASGDMNRFDNDLNRIARAVDKMQSLLNELLELSRIGRIINPPVEVNFNEIVQETLELLSGPLEAGNIRMNVEKEFPTVYVDRLRLAEVVQNLVSNAIKFMGDQPRPTIEIGTRGLDTDGKPIFYVRDNGIGIDQQYQERIFGLFNRLDPNIEGTGIGLTLVKRIIDNHEGRIWVESESGKGATFLFTLPIPGNS
jgi:PAS domain S-box-containing protein